MNTDNSQDSRGREGTFISNFACDRLRHMKNKGMKQSHALSQNSEAIDV